MTTKVAFFSTDFSESPVKDEYQSQIQGKDVFRQGVRKLEFGGTFLQRGAMPAMEMTKHDDWDCHLAWRFRSAPDGHIETLDVEGNWRDDISCVVTQRWMHKDGPDQFRRARATGQIIISELDDNFWQLGKTNVAYHTTDPKNNPDFNRNHYWESLKASSAITVSTEALRKQVERLGIPTYVLRNAIDIERWPQNDPGGDGMISWIGGIQWRAHDLFCLRPVLPGFLLEHGLPAYHGGDSNVPEVPKFHEQVGIDVSKTQVVYAPLMPIGEYTKLWEPVNLALVPLEKVAFNQAKSFLKSLEACCAGVPYIVSHGFPEQQILIDEGSAGRVAKNEKPQQWYDHLTDLLDPDLRRKEGAINRAVAEKHDIRIQWKFWDAAYKEILQVT